jgi:ABC-type antimicrobial peptide transport system permease subunit
MVLGFILPLALAFVAVPLESFIHSARTVGGALLVNLVSTLAFALRLLGNSVRQASRALVHAYDVLIVLPLMLEQVVRSKRSGASARAAHPLDAAEKTLHPS